MKALSHPTLPTLVFDSREEAELAVAREITALLREKPDAVLGLATGTTPIGLYERLVRAHRDDGLSFARATTFNLDEYLDVDPAASFARWMHEHVFAHVDLPGSRAHLPTVEGAARVEGAAGVEVPAEDAARVAREYEAAIRSAGGIDLQVLGIGRNGHVAFNEPGCERTSRTRVVELARETREDAANAFGGIENEPVRAITMGVATILDARRIRVMAFGERKAEIVRRTLLEPVTPACPATFLRGHPDIVMFLDREAGSLLPV